MQIEWSDRDPIYRQLADRLVDMIMDGDFEEGDGLPSVRQIAAEQRINPITVSRAFQLLVDQGVVDKRRGLGMFVASGAHARLLDSERQEFLQQEWPRIRARIERLGFTAAQLFAADSDNSKENGND